MSVRARRVRAVVVATLLVGASAQAERAPSNDYIRGYADAILSDEFSLDAYVLEVQDGTIRLTLHDPSRVESDTLVRALLAIEGVERVDIRDEDGDAVAQTGTGDGERDAEPPGWELFPPLELFEPLLADPRWPHFSATYQRYLSNHDLRHVGVVSFGESFALLRSPESPHGRTELGVQAGMFSVFDLAASSSDLLNTDYTVGLTLSHRIRALTGLLRVYHQSSHLGDEYLFRNHVDLVEVSFEALDLLLSYDVAPWLRVYGGGGLLLHRRPHLDRWSTQLGIELESPAAYLSGHIRPIAAADLQLRQESDWRTDLSTRFGFQIEHDRLRRLRVQILGEYFRGRSPNGQFYARRIENLGVGVHLGF